MTKRREEFPPLCSFLRQTDTEVIEMKRILKYICAWFAMMLATLMIVNFGIVRMAARNILIPELSGYNEKMTFPLTEPKDAAEEKKQGGIMWVRSLLCNSEYSQDHGFLANWNFSNYTVRESYVFLNPKGVHDFSYGIFAYAYHTPAEGESAASHPIGLIDIRALCKQEGAAALLDALSAHPDAAVHLDSYSVQGRLVKPARITLTEAESEKVLFSQDFAAEGEIIPAADALLLNSYNEEDFGSGIVGKLRLGMQDERECDKKAAELASRSMQGETLGEQDRFGFGKSTHTAVYDTKGYRMIYSSEMIFWKCTLFYTLTIGAVFTLLLLTVFLVRRHDAQAA